MTREEQAKRIKEAKTKIEAFYTIPPELRRERPKRYLKKRKPPQK